jgi:hypothetical protein
MHRPARASGVLLLLALVFSLAAVPGALAAPRSDRALTGPTAGDALDIALGYLRANHGQYGLKKGDIADIAVADRYTSPHNGVTHLYLRQAHRGIGVVGAEINANVAADGSIVSLNSSFIPNLRAAIRGEGAARSAEASVKGVAQSLGLQAPGQLKVKEHRGGPAAEVVFDTNGISLEPITTRLVYQPAGDVVRLAWQIELYEPDGDHWWNLRVDASTGEVLARDDYAAHADGSYNVFPIPNENPDEAGGVRTLVVNPATSASPLGWIDDDQTLTQGNNVLAYADRNADNLPDSGGFADGGPGLVFDHPLDFEDPPEEYQDAAVTNLFYWNNVIHDVLYGYGFDEKSGNFQQDNFGRQNGKGGDPVRAEAQDGSGRNNANFFTPPDGFRPRMQMFEWRDPAPNPLTVDGVGTFSGPMAGFGSSLATTGAISGTLVLVDDGTSPISDGCEPFTLPEEPDDTVVTIALMDRGLCTFVTKVKNAQDAGAEAAVVANNNPDPPFGMGGADPSITIPSIMISQADGVIIKPALPESATLAPNENLQPDRDSDLDNGVIIHEYGHGVSNRLTGGPGNAGCLQNAEQMGEGWSDFLALMLTQRASDTPTTNRGVGNYVVFEGPDGVGIRPTPYTTNMAVNDATYATVIEEAGTPSLTIPHGVGYVWATMLWEMNWNLIGAHGYNPDIYESWTEGGNNLTLQLVMDGMKFQPCSPGFVKGRNAILEADLALTGGENQCLIWDAFAKRGLGFSAEERSSKKTGDGTAAFDLPPECGSAGVVVPLAPALATRALMGLPGALRRRLRTRA